MTDSTSQQFQEANEAILTGGGFRVQVSSGFSWFFQGIGAGPAGVGAG